MKRSITLLAGLLLVLLIGLAGGQQIVAAERRPSDDKVSSAADTRASQTWAKSFWNAEDPARWPISFSLEGKPFRDFIAGWSALPAEHRADDGKETTVLRRRDPATGLELRVEIITYRNWPVVEWTAFLQNNGGGNSPELRGLQAVFRVVSGDYRFV